MTIDPLYLVLENSAWVERMLACGVKLIQLRVKGAEDEALRAEIVRAKNLCARAGARFVVNDHWRLALELGCAHVHLGQDDLAGADLAALRAAGLSLGVSTETEDDLDRALALGADWIALQPIFATASKAFERAPQGLARLRQWRERLNGRPLIAIGGIKLGNANAVFAAGADCVALISDVTRAPDPERRARDWLAATRRRL
ncbi:thiamine-phosphate diphosphorylase [Rhodoblastus acidophilus]|uniref:Thiamine-phosphate synthase n=1 Tax=Rhodoblastus acidophilus TaxID=1074 RepID=A0A212PVQ0_RHOAC|nr:thiamine phosphate synthase [Rhodoblastus acidophilus]PPQ37856.1 thiamine phosphate synthase [Rhodoblastus acidophilus]RAI17127.1 thiamine phosphate synthase [Rhodoblastus acidophilus]SNB50978.1 thiamine-phosphate diphosphorylase [Rhodoblastus acidophilus]